MYDNKEIIDLYPKMGFKVKFKISTSGGKFHSGHVYQITGFGFGKPNENGQRREFWELSDLNNPQFKPGNIWKSELNRLFDQNKIEDV